MYDLLQDVEIGLHSNFFQGYSVGEQEFLFLFGCKRVRVGYNNNFMKNNFDINIPTIPSKTIKFKIQDIKSTAFGTQKNRFIQNKSFLTKKFIDSFSNFRPKSYTSTETEAESKSESRIASTQRPIASEQQYRVFIPQEKKHMLHHLDKYRNYQAPILKETKYNRGYSFYKTDLSMPAQDKLAEYEASIENNVVSDSYFFPSTKGRLGKQPSPVKTNTPSCVFKNETRARAYLKQDALLNKIGPGQYNSELAPKEIKKPIRKQPNKSDIDVKKLTKIITSIVGPPEEEKQLDEAGKQKEEKPNHMFIIDDRDRFGQQKYPIAAKLSVPGPGAYQIKDSIEQISQKVVVLEEQRKLLKEWFNN